MLLWDLASHMSCWACGGEGGVGTGAGWGVLTAGLRLPDPTAVIFYQLKHLTQYLINVSCSCIVLCSCVSLKTAFPQFLF